MRWTSLSLHIYSYPSFFRNKFQGNIIGGSLGGVMLSFWNIVRFASLKSGVRLCQSTFHQHYRKHPFSWCISTREIDFLNLINLIHEKSYLPDVTLHFFDVRRCNIFICYFNVCFFICLFLLGCFIVLWNKSKYIMLLGQVVQGSEHFTPYCCNYCFILFFLSPFYRFVRI